MTQQAIVIDPSDSIAVAVTDLAAGQVCTVRVGRSLQQVELRDAVPFGHKFALHSIPRGTDVLKYGEVIGESTADIKPGDWVHLHNLASTRGHERQEIAR